MRICYEGEKMSIAFGPVPSRRLGRSLGINNIPPKSCSYSCLYCQVGATHGQLIKPQEFYAPENIYHDVSEQLQKARSSDEPVDYLTFVPDGEPTLDSNLGKAIDLLRPLNIPIAVISNASLLWHKDVRAATGKADWVSVKVDSLIEGIWKQINRPHEALRLDDIMNGIRQFALQFHGELVAETMLINDINDNEASVTSVADFLHEIGVSRSYLSIPTRPTAETSIRGPSEVAMNRAYQILASRLPHVECLVGYEGDAFAFTGDVRHDLLSITAVHPMRESAVRDLLGRAKAEWSIVEELIAKGMLKEVDYLDKRYFVRCFAAPREDKTRE
jgi:wyosine [tRNA(Phe)-imidazoG37] synthetase (radical SAM superfamily)